MVKTFLVVSNRGTSADWRISTEKEYEIVGETNDFYFVWANGRQVSFPKHMSKYHIVKREVG